MLTQFVLPNGHEVYGILMEYVPAPSLKTGVARTLPREQQAQLVRGSLQAYTNKSCQMKP